MVYTLNAPINTSYTNNNVAKVSPFAQFEMKMVSTPLVASNLKQETDTVVIKKQKPMTTANDGKFSTKVAVNNFFKGVFSPITSMFNSYKSFAIGMGTIAAGAALCSIGFAPALIAIGTVIGGLQAATTLYQVVTAKNGDDVEKACYGAGVATSTLGLTVLGAKGALSSAGENTANISRLSALKGCFKHTPGAFNRAFAAIKTNIFRNPFAKTVKLTPQEHLARIENVQDYHLMDKHNLIVQVKDPYKVLGVDKHATDVEMKTAFKSIARIFHPDKPGTGNEEIFKIVSSSYDMLKSSSTKSAFDHAFAQQRLSLTPSATILQTFNRED